MSTEQNGNGDQTWRHSNDKVGNINPPKKKTVKQMMGDKFVESTSKIFKNDKKKIKPKDDDSD